MVFTTRVFVGSVDQPPVEMRLMFPAEIADATILAAYAFVPDGRERA